ncbi:MAG TPA: hypothetical protein ENJ68_01210 [Devosia sp.]|nr:hypothetical protein [Devosia sp.]
MTGFSYRYASGPFLFALVVILGATAAVPVRAQSVQVLGDFRDWSAYTANDGSGPICFAMSSPKSVEPEPDGYGEAHIYLTHRTVEGLRAEFNLIAGYEFAPDLPATAKIGGRVYELFTQGDAAWLADPAQAQTFAANIRSGSTLLIEGTSALGVKVVQSFSLSGATAASRAIDRAC